MSSAARAASPSKPASQRPSGSTATAGWWDGQRWEPEGYWGTWQQRLHAAAAFPLPCVLVTFCSAQCAHIYSRCAQQQAPTVVHADEALDLPQETSGLLTAAPFTVPTDSQLHAPEEQVRLGQEVLKKPQSKGPWCTQQACPCAPCACQ